MNTETRLIYREERGHTIGRGKARAGATQRQGHGKPSSILRGERLLLYTRGRVSLFPKEGMQTPSPYRVERVCLLDIARREERKREREDVKAKQGKPRQRYGKLGHVMSCLAPGSLSSL